MAAGISDEQLIQQAIGGSAPAFSTLVKRYERYVLTLAMRFVRSRESAHEVSQDSFLKAFRYLADFRGECKFSTWLYKIVYSVALNHLRRKNPEWVSLDDAERPVVAAETSTEADVSVQLDIQDRNAVLYQAIGRLSPDDAAVITLFYLHEQSLDEICIITGFTMSNAKTKLCRARQRLRHLMEQ
jgi:RNA polymerase sigma factor (sigma-70 family)